MSSSGSHRVLARRGGRRRTGRTGCSDHTRPRRNPHSGTEPPELSLLTPTGDRGQPSIDGAVSIMGSGDGDLGGR